MTIAYIMIHGRIYIFHFSHKDIINSYDLNTNATNVIIKLALNETLIHTKRHWIMEWNIIAQTVAIKQLRMEV